MNIKDIIINHQENLIVKISELRLHKVLYFLYGLYWKEYNKEVFSPDFRAWTFGPIETENQREFKLLEENNNKIHDSKFDIKEEDSEKIKGRIIYILNKYSNIFELSNGKLILYSHITNPWLKVMEKKKTSLNKIDPKDIQNYFENEDFQTWDDDFVKERGLQIVTKRYKIY